MSQTFDKALAEIITLQTVSAPVCLAALLLRRYALGRPSFNRLTHPVLLHFLRITGPARADQGCARPVTAGEADADDAAMSRILASPSMRSLCATSTCTFTFPAQRTIPYLLFIVIPNALALTIAHHCPSLPFVCVVRCRHAIGSRLGARDPLTAKAHSKASTQHPSSIIHHYRFSSSPPLHHLLLLLLLFVFSSLTPTLSTRLAHPSRSAYK